MPFKKHRVRHHVNPLSITHKHDFSGFGNNNKIIVDVGACKGEFVYELLKKYPHYNFILFEIRNFVAEKLRKKFEKFGNVKIFDGDAGLNFREILEPSIKKNIDVVEIFINFPDPWFKEKHKKRRFVNDKLIKKCREFISAKTKFIFQTDQETLFQETLEVLKSENIKNINFFEQSPHNTQTHWEKEKMENGEKIFRMEFYIE